MEDMLKKIAVAIQEECGEGHCPCYEKCNAYTNEECMNEIMNWLNDVIK